MRPVLYVLSFLALIALGFWAYRENYATQAALREVRALHPRSPTCARRCRCSGPNGPI
jgi:hypothetical protein